MKPMLRVICTLGFFFVCVFLIGRFSGLLSIEIIEGWFEAAKNLPPEYTALIVIGLLVSDLIISVPTMSIMILSGFFLGHVLGALAGITGLMLTGCLGYLISYRFGGRFIALILKDKEQRQQAETTFLTHGFIVIALSRAVPMLPEISACMAGITRMRFPLFLAAWSINTIPYAMIAAYAGSISSLHNPAPAIVTAIGLTFIFWCGWFVFRHINKRNQKA